MILLAIDTSAGAGSLALSFGGRAFELEIDDSRGQTASLPGRLHALLGGAGCTIARLEGIACGIGPGSFTSLRVGVAYAQGLALGLGCPAVGVSSLAMLAHAAGPGDWVVAQDARQGEVYLGVYRVAEGMAPELLLPEQVGPANGAPALPAGNFGCAGNAWDAYGDALREALGLGASARRSSAVLHARHALAIGALRLAAGQGADACALQPNYLRERVALTLVEQRGGVPLR